MFTGIVETVGRIGEARDAAGLREFQVETDASFLEDLRPGASVAVDGACLTAVAIHSNGFSVEVVETTLSRTVAASYREGSLINLERAMSVGDRLDGHLVQGHIDGLGHLLEIRGDDGHRILEAAIPGEVHKMTLLHGSITLNGVSLTVNRLQADNCIEVAVIPHTWDVTNLRHLSPGDSMNVEGDLIGKYVGKLLRYKEDGLPEESRDAV